MVYHEALGWRVALGAYLLFFVQGRRLRIEHALSGQQVARVERFGEVGTSAFSSLGMGLFKLLQMAARRRVDIVEGFARLLDAAFDLCLRRWRAETLGHCHVQTC